MTIASTSLVDAYRQRLAELSTVAFWELPDLHEPSGPEVSHVWHWDEVVPELLRSKDVDGDVAGRSQRRALLLRNPGLPGPAFGATPTLVAAYQALLPGESAPVHRHSFSALRFGVDGDAARMTVGDQDVPLFPGDLLLTPSWSWHGHDHVGGDDPVVWFDGLDVPFVAGMRAGVFDEPAVGVADAPVADGLLPADARNGVVRNPWEDAAAELDRLLAESGSEGATLDYRSSTTGGPMLATIDCQLRALGAHGATTPRRESASAVVLVVRGSGTLVTAGGELELRRNDVAALPAWKAHAVRAGADGLVLLRISDRPVLDALGLSRSEPTA